AALKWWERIAPSVCARSYPTSMLSGNAGDAAWSEPASAVGTDVMRSPSLNQRIQNYHMWIHYARSRAVPTMGVSVSRMIASVRTVATNETAALGPDRLRQFLALSRLHSDGWGTAWTDPQSGEVRVAGSATESASTGLPPQLDVGST